MGMSKKDFIALADDLKGVHVTQDVENALMRFMRSRNPRFDGYRWHNYLYGKCGPSGGVIRVKK